MKRTPPTGHATPGQLLDALIDRLDPAESVSVFVPVASGRPRHVTFEVSDRAPFTKADGVIRIAQAVVDIDLSLVPAAAVGAWADGLTRELRPAEPEIVEVDA